MGGILGCLPGKPAGSRLDSGTILPMQQTPKPSQVAHAQPLPSGVPPTAESAAIVAVEVGGPAGPEPTRFGDWERNGRCVDF